MPNSRYKSYENLDNNTPRNSHYGEGRRIRSRSRDYFEEDHNFEDSAEANFSYADDDDNPIYAQPGFASVKSSQKKSNERMGKTNKRNSERSPDRTNRSLYNGGHGSDNEAYYDDFEVYDVDGDQGVPNKVSENKKA